jgi:hypothetical protein
MKILIYPVGKFGDALVSIPAIHGNRDAFPKKWMLDSTAKCNTLAKDLCRS